LSFFSYHHLPTPTTITYREPDYDWLVTYDEIRPQLRNYVQEDNKILMVGCGNSTLSADMVRTLGGGGGGGGRSDEILKEVE